MTPGPSALEGSITRPTTPVPSQRLIQESDEDVGNAGSSQMRHISTTNTATSPAGHRTGDQQASSPVILTALSSAHQNAKLCTRCGQSIPPDLDAPASSLLNSPSISALSAPSPSSIAFAPPIPSPPQTSSVLSTLQPSLRIASRSSDGGGALLCTTCASYSSSTTVESEMVRREEDDSWNQSHQDELLDADGDAMMAATSGPTSPTSAEPLELSTSPHHQVSVSSLSVPFSPVLHHSQTSPTAPWRRGPWATSSQSGESSAVVVETGLETNSDDVVMDEEDYPPLPRQPTSPTLSQPSAPGRRPSSPLPPTERARNCSFSRSQSVSGCMSDSENPAPHKRTRPVVLVPSSSSSMIRTRSSSSNSSVSSLGRTASSTRRHSRAPAALNVTPSFAAVGDALVSETQGVGESSTFGPHLMTRPPLSSVFVLPKAGKGNHKARSSLDSFPQPLHDMIPAAYQRKYSLPRVDMEGTSASRWYDALRPDPLADATLRPVQRMPSRGRGCLFPGAVFNGTQKSGRDSYNVTVQIVNVDLPASHLCGYLNIRGLTPAWPELTTYFDAEIIGNRHGFLTGKWGATEADDIKHWSRFAPFHPFRSHPSKNDLRFNHLNKNFVFMRWKERFLVPDHRVRDINGASFAGFYYVCVELGDDHASDLAAPVSPSLAAADTSSMAPAEDAMMGDTSSRARPLRPTEGSAVRGSERSPAPPLLAEGATAGRMSGFYFHENTAPYQQLTLQHVPQRASTSFEMR